MPTEETTRALISRHIPIFYLRPAEDSSILREVWSQGGDKNRGIPSKTLGKLFKRTQSTFHSQEENSLLSKLVLWELSTETLELSTETLEEEQSGATPRIQ